VGAVSADAAGAGLRQVEVDARLGLGSLDFRLDLDAVATPMDFPSGLWMTPRVFPEWAAARLAMGGGWSLAGGVRPLPVPGEELDGWNNPLVPYSQSFATRWPGALLGGWIEGGREAQLSAWGGVQTGPGVAPAAEGAVVGGGLGLGDGGLTGELTLSVLPLQSRAVLTGEVDADLGEPAQLTGAAWVTGWPDGMLAALLGTVVLIPDNPVNPVGRVEWSPGAGSSDWVVDAGARWRPEPFLQVAATGRVAGDRFGAYLGISFFEDPEGGDPNRW
jgi:hypothetical protein